MNKKKTTTTAIALLLIVFGLTSCYTIKSQTIKEPIYCGIFINQTDIYGLENELALYLPTALRKEYMLVTSSGQHKAKHQLVGKITHYRKTVVRRDTNGIPTHQQVKITVSYTITTKDKKGQRIESPTNSINNIDYRLNSGYYNIIKGETESTAKAQALRDLAGLMATNTSLHFLGQ